ncbi:MAG TPA: type II toxin-antitoxin system VapC family toxin [Thermoanaerobaculia bacterium]|nr:type II toxin-antitoxin system VapC family toxin [Thermoanaerobaculia bacterium]
MAWVVDTCMLIDILEDDPEFGSVSALSLDTHAADGLVLCPMTYVELAPAFNGDQSLQDEFLMGIGVDFRQDWLWEDSVRAFDAWNTFIQRRRARLAPKRPLADILIGSFASRYDGLLTRNPDDFRSAFPDLQLRVPSPHDEGTD